jgi:hypothetical protein
MLSPRWRPVLYSLIALIVIWAAALAGFTIARNARVTPEKVRAYVEGTDFNKLSANERTKVIDKLARMLNGLSLQERREAHLDEVSRAWFAQMTEEEKARFLEATMPTGFKQMLAAFEQMPEEKRKLAIDNTLRRLKEQQARNNPGGATNRNGTNAPPLSPELEAKVRSIGLQTFYSQSSAQTKAEMAPVLEELQRTMESGRAFRGR